MLKDIVRSVAIAQSASDAGKNFFNYSRRSFCRASDEEREEGERLLAMFDRSTQSRIRDLRYRLKDRCIFQAMKQISSSHCKESRFFVQGDEEGVARYIVYFDFKVEGKRYQVSFHSYNESLEKWSRASSGSRGHWDEKSSRKACIALLELV